MPNQLQSAAPLRHDDIIWPRVKINLSSSKNIDANFAQNCHEKVPFKARFESNI
jgi:hypothetical protein